jgi:hypothetical protein
MHEVCEVNTCFILKSTTRLWVKYGMKESDSKVAELIRFLLVTEVYKIQAYVWWYRKLCGSLESTNVR